MKTIEQMYEEKHKRIQEYRSETQLSIQLGQALNLAVEVLNNDKRMGLVFNWDEKMNELVDYFMSYLDKKRREVFDANERMYAQNPTPTVTEYEAMNATQKAFLKDKQLEKNRADYQARKVAEKQKGLQVDFKKLNDERIK